MSTDRRAGWWRAGAVCAALAAAAGPGAAQPLSAIDWLSQSVAVPPPPPAPREPGVTGSAAPEPIAVSPLDGPVADAAGLLAPQVTGLPAALWGPGRTEDIVTALSRDRPDLLPGARALFQTLLLAEAQPPADSGGTGRLLLARVDALLAMGALETAAALIAASGPPGPDLFRRAFDIALLTGAEDAACADLSRNAGLAPTFPARIFCLARQGDWNAAALTLRTAEALSAITPSDEVLLARFLDPALAEEGPPLPLPDRPSPLVWRLHEAVGEPLPTTGLPLAFAHADLRATAGWKAQLEAAERLARMGALAPNALLALYTERRPAASGGVWDRVAAVQALDAALAAADPAAVARALPPLVAAAETAELEVPLASLFADRLATLDLVGQAGRLALRLALLAPGHPPPARAPQDATEAFLLGLARGDVAGLAPPDSLA
ncbi:MAG: hypothetical protein IE927_10195, partial [Rhodobacterales bacterium]|nr:hypothetical protein [Rhodobacterales bacterium]